jgi:Flp pilus assembly protein TadD
MELCSDEEMSALVDTIQSDDQGDLAAVEKLLLRYRDDPRLHFMRGSILAGRRRHVEAHASLAKAVELAPEFHIARYQLGFFELTSGEADKALSTWGPLLRLPEETYFRKFVEGLTCLIRDEFAQAIAFMREGLALNQDNEPLNNDIRLLISETEKTAKQAHIPGEEGSDRSATSVLLGFSDKPTRH